MSTYILSRSFNDVKVPVDTAETAVAAIRARAKIVAARAAQGLEPIEIHIHKVRDGRIVATLPPEGSATVALTATQTSELLAALETAETDRPQDALVAALRAKVRPDSRALVVTPLEASWCAGAMDNYAFIAADNGDATKARNVAAAARKFRAVSAP